MNLAAGLFFICALAAHLGVHIVYAVHMLQLNSYRPERFRRWAAEHRRQLAAPRHGLPAAACILSLAAILFPAIPVWSGTAAAGGLLLLSALMNIPGKGKKPLALTPRTGRLFATCGVLAAALAAAAVWIPAGWGIPAACLLALPTPWWAAAANRLKIPLENAIARRYVADARRKLAGLPSLTVIGITGSYGKTSAKAFLHALLSVKYNVLMTPESYNTLLGVVRTIREQLQPSHEIFLVEMGAKQPGDIAAICDLVHPRYGIITAIGEQHLETFGTLNNIIRTKFELADALPLEGVIFLNTDNSHIRSQPVGIPAVTYGADGSLGAAYTASDIQADSRGSTFTVSAPGGESHRFATRLLGTHNIQNLTGCIAVAHTLGISLRDLVYPVRMIKPVPHRLQLLPGGIIDDAYNANPVGFRAALDVLSGFVGQRVLITPGMVELGERQIPLNRELGAYAAGRCDYAILVGERQAPPLKEGLLEAGFPSERLIVVPTLTEGMNRLRSLPVCGPRTVLLENDLPDNF